MDKSQCHVVVISLVSFGYFPILPFNFASMFPNAGIGTAPAEAFTYFLLIKTRKT